MIPEWLQVVAATVAVVLGVAALAAGAVGGADA